MDAGQRLQRRKDRRADTGGTREIQKNGFMEKQMTTRGERKGAVPCASRPEASALTIEENFDLKGPLFCVRVRQEGR